MTTKAVLIIGGSGFVGAQLALALRDEYKVFLTYNRHRISIGGVTCLPMALHNRDWAKRVVYLSKPDYIIYAAGSNDVNWCENNSRDTEQLHTSGAATISNISDILQPTFIYLSNPYIFDGARGNYKESDIVLPTTALGKGKLGGENFIRSKSLSYVIIRSSTLLGRSAGSNRSFMDKLRMGLDRGQRLDLTNDEIHNFAPIQGLSELIKRIIETGMRKRVFHYGGLDKMTFYEFGRAFAQRFGYDPRLLTPCHSHHRMASGLNPESSVSDYSLNCTAAVEALKIQPFFLEQSFDLIDQQLISRA